MGFTSPLKHRGELLLAVGFAVWVVAFAPFFPIAWLIAQLYAGPPALLLLTLGLWRARNGAASAGRQAAGLVLLILGIGALYWTSLETMTLANQLFPPKATTPATGSPTRAVAIWLLPAIFWAIGLRSWTGWPARRCLGWAGVVFGLHLAELAGFWLLLLTDPPRAA